MKLLPGTFRKKDGSVWADLHCVVGVIVDNLTLAQVREKSKLDFRDQKCYCKTCSQELEMRESQFVKLCKCHIPE